MEETTHPVLAAVAFLATLIFGGPNLEIDMTQEAPTQIPLLISVDPDPLVAGQTGEVCYAFPAGATQPVVLKITWFLSDGTRDGNSVSVDPSSPCATVQVPAKADSVSVEDLSGGSIAYGGAVN